MSRLRYSAALLALLSSVSGAQDWTSGPGQAKALLDSSPAKALADRARGPQAAAAAGRWPDAIERAQKATVRIETDSHWGSGFILRANGLVVTNAHVVPDVKIGGELKVLVEGVEHKGKLVASGNKDCRDIAFVQLSGRTDWPTLALATSDPRLGEEVLALGYPDGPKEKKGPAFTVTRGIVSGLNRLYDDSACHRYVQTDASVNAANSGGPLIGADGGVVGINTWGFLEKQQLNFAIRSPDLVKALEQFDRVQHLAEGSLGLAVGFDDKRKKVVVRQVYGGRSAAKAGIYQGDVLAAYNGVTPAGDEFAVDAFVHWVRNLVPGDRVTLTVLRGGNPRQIPLVVEKHADPPPQRVAEIRNPKG
ncbi:MAG: trypsin-like peptidase domain-containing protein [Elusimicrobia bacterium]|nr:trypsin-like peptidase domain-containing protein [Elusimicrobiota bacterium]